MGQHLEPFRFFPIGSSYYPPFHSPEDWVRDIARMADAGLNTLRTAELIASWEWLEPKRGQYDFHWLDRVFDLCEQHGLRVLLGTGAGSPPVWLLDEYPDVQIVSQDGIPYPTGAMWGWACIHHLGFRAEAERYLRTLLARYGKRPALLGWQIHNEIGYPAIQRLPGYTEVYCYCAHTVVGFRQWLRAKYGDVEALSEAWACTPTRHRYHNWSQVRPPRSAPTAWGSPGAWLDWRTYIAQSFADFVAWQNRLIKESDKTHPTTTNLVRLLDAEFGAIRGIDPWLYPEACDAFGFDLYPRDRFREEPFYTSLQLDYARSPALHANKPFWLPEIESGPIGEWVLGPSHATTGRDIRRCDLESIGHGAKMLLYQGYREWDPLPLHWGALVDLNGEPTERYQEARLVNRVVQAHEALFVAAQPIRAQIGILVDQRNAIVCQGMGAGDMLLRAIKGAYYAFWVQHYPVEFVTPETLHESRGASYRLLLLPFLMLVTPDCAMAVDEYVRNGGTVVAFAKCGMLNEKSWYWHDRPGGLCHVFGAREVCISKSDDVILRPEPDAEMFRDVDGPLAGYWHRQEFVLADDTQVLARYEDGLPAVTTHSYGQGRAVLFGTHFDVAAMNPNALGHHRVFANLAQLAGVQRQWSIEGNPLLDGHLLEFGDVAGGREGSLFVLVNHRGEKTRSQVCLHSTWREVEVTDLFAGRRLHAECSEEGLRFHVNLGGYESTVLLIQPSERSGTQGTT